jgi:oleate hydratase
MVNYFNVHAPAPEGIENKHAHIVGGGIAGLAAAVFLIDDAHMPAKNITIYERRAVMGGAMDCFGDPKTGGYYSRGGRMLCRHMECLWYLAAKIPSIYTPGITVLDETYRHNEELKINDTLRCIHKRGQLYPVPPSNEWMSPADSMKMLELLLTPEDKLEGMTIGEWFTKDFTKSYFWQCWAYIFAFADYHSLVEAKRYLQRFAHFTRGLPMAKGILNTKYNEYDSLVRPIQTHLLKQGVNIQLNSKVVDIVTEDKGKETVATALVYVDDAGKQTTKALTRDDLVFFTNGSIPACSRQGGSNDVVSLNRDTKDRECFTVWEKMAARNPKKFGNPAVFISDIEKTKFYTYTATITGDPLLHDILAEKMKQDPRRNCLTTIVDAPWVPTWFMYGKYFPNQPADVHIFHGYTLFSHIPGSYVKKPASECTGHEIFTEILWQIGLTPEQINQVISHSDCTVAAMPYATAQFLPRKLEDRPKIVPDGSVNLSFLGQWVEHGLDCPDVVYTVESSVRSAMSAVYRLTKLEKPEIPMYWPLDSVRVLADMVKTTTGADKLSTALLDAVGGNADEHFKEVVDNALGELQECEP